jgi:hypothetical protein
MPMKPAMTAFALTVMIVASPAAAFSVDTSSLFPTLSYPAPAPQPVTQGTAGMDR